VVAQVDKSPWKTRVASLEGGNVVVEGGRDVNMSFEYRLSHQPVPSRGAGSTGEPLRVASSELAVMEIRDVTSVAKPVVPTPAPDIRPGDWVVFSPTTTSPR